MHEKKGYWVYSCVVIVAFVALFAFVGYLIYDLIIKLSDKDFSNNTVIQALITLIITVFIGGYFSKWLERRNARKLELYKTQTTISINVIDLSSLFIWDPDNEETRRQLVCESNKVKLFFNDDTLRALNEFIYAEDKKQHYDTLVDAFKKCIKD